MRCVTTGKKLFIPDTAAFVGTRFRNIPKTIAAHDTPKRILRKSPTSNGAEAYAEFEENKTQHDHTSQQPYDNTPAVITTCTAACTASSHHHKIASKARKTGKLSAARLSRTWLSASRERRSRISSVRFSHKFRFVVRASRISIRVLDG